MSNNPSDFFDLKCSLSDRASYSTCLLRRAFSPSFSGGMAALSDEDSDIETGAKRRLTNSDSPEEQLQRRLTNSDSPEEQLHQQGQLKVQGNGVSCTTRSDVNEQRRHADGSVDEQTRVYTKRYAILGMFILLSASNAMQWIEYSIIAHIISAYYGVSYSAVDWTSMIYMLTYMILMFPGSWFLEKFGLRKSILIGACGNCFGAWLKILSTAPDRFWLTFIVGSSQVFILGIPPRLAAVWFGPEQVSTACAAGVFGNQLGIAIGFVLPPWLVHEKHVTFDLTVLFLISALTNTVIFLIIILFFEERPLVPPSVAQIQALDQSSDQNFFRSVRKLISNPNFVLLVITYGINVGVFYAISTLLSQMVLFFNPTAQEAVGTCGVLIVLSGMLGSVTCGYILDKSHHFKATTLVVYLFSFFGMVLFTLTLAKVPIWGLFIISILLGFFMTGYLPLGFEFAAELTFPIAEGTTSGLLNGSAQAFGIGMTFGMGLVMQSLSIFWCNFIMSFFLLIGFLLTAIIKSDLRRQRAHNQQQQRTETG
uniref:Major facilitator superfamily (MFS) profile domain-containing protein n=1 Tax=Globodera rostochiensis TaxID=31243 RepID=A0A914H242_GLORO